MDVDKINYSKSTRYRKKLTHLIKERYYFTLQHSRRSLFLIAIFLLHLAKND